MRAYMDGFDVCITKDNFEDLQKSEAVFIRAHKPDLDALNKLFREESELAKTEIEELKKENKLLLDEVCDGLERLFVYILKTHFPDNKVTEPLTGDAPGLISQLSNALTKWREDAARIEDLEKTVKILKDGTGYKELEDRYNARLTQDIEFLAAQQKLIGELQNVLAVLGRRECLLAKARSDLAQM